MASSGSMHLFHVHVSNLIPSSTLTHVNHFLLQLFEIANDPTFTFLSADVDVHGIAVQDEFSHATRLHHAVEQPEHVDDHHGNQEHWIAPDVERAHLRLAYCRCENDGLTINSQNWIAFWHLYTKADILKELLMGGSISILR